MRIPHVIKAIIVLTPACFTGGLPSQEESVTHPDPRVWLEPCSPLEAADGQFLEYQYRLAKVLDLRDYLSNDSGPPVARLLASAGHDPEWVVSIYHPQHSGCFVKATMARRSVWRTNSHPDGRPFWHRSARIRATTHLATIPCVLAAQAEAVWQGMLGRLRMPQTGDPGFTGGTTTFIVSSPDGNMGHAICGQTYHPPVASPVEALTTTGQMLFDYAQTPAALQPEMQEKIHASLDEIVRRSASAEGK